MDLHERVEQLERQIRELSRTKLTDPNPIHHGERWKGPQEKTLFWELNDFVTSLTSKLGRSRQGVRIKLLRMLKEDYPEDWSIADRR